MTRTSAPARTIEDFLRKKKGTSASSEAAHRKWEERKDRYVTEVGDLFKKIAGWLDKLKKNGPVSYQLKDTSGFEDGIGQYSIPSMDIYIGDRMIMLLPIGTKIYGALGRVDVIGNFEEAHLIMKEWGKWLLLDSPYISGKEPSTINFTEKEFKDVLLMLVSE